MKPKLKPPGTKRLKLNCDTQLSTSAFKFNLRRYTTGVDYCKRYYTLKKGILKKTQGLEEFTWADRNAAIDIGTAAESYTWTEAGAYTRPLFSSS